MENGLAQYGTFIKEIKDLIYRHQYEAMKQVNKELMLLYWKIGKEIDRKQHEQGWGKSVVEILSKELQKEFTGVQGFSSRNLWRMRTFYVEYTQNTILPPMRAELDSQSPKEVLHPLGAEKAKANLQSSSAELEDAPNITNLESMISEIGNAILPPLVAEVSWTKNCVIVCKNKKRMKVEYALKLSNAPIGVATYTFHDKLPEEMRVLLPSPDEIERIINGFDEEIETVGLLGLNDGGGDSDD